MGQKTPNANNARLETRGLEGPDSPLVRGAAARRHGLALSPALKTDSNREESHIQLGSCLTQRWGQITLPNGAIAHCRNQLHSIELETDKVSGACSLAEEVMHKATNVDECLLPYLNSINEATEQGHLDYLLAVIAKPIAQQSLQRAFQQDQIKDSYGTGRLDIDDAVSEILLKILQRLRLLKADPTGHAISNFRGLVATTAYRTCTPPHNLLKSVFARAG